MPRVVRPRIDLLRRFGRPRISVHDRLAVAQVLEHLSLPGLGLGSGLGRAGLLGRGRSRRQGKLDQIGERDTRRGRRSLVGLALLLRTLLPGRDLVGLGVGLGLRLLDRLGLHRLLRLDEQRPVRDARLLADLARAELVLEQLARGRGDLGRDLDVRAIAELRELLHRRLGLVGPDAPERLVHLRLVAATRDERDGGLDAHALELRVERQHQSAVLEHEARGAGRTSDTERTHHLVGGHGGPCEELSERPLVASCPVFRDESPFLTRPSSIP